MSYHCNQHIKRIWQQNKGVTMVELVVTFALLSIFMVTATMCISHAVTFFFDEQQQMSSFTIADLVYSEVKDEIRTMQGSDGEHKGYIKLRNPDGAADYASGTYTGSIIEFVVSNISNGATAVQIDTAGCDDYMIDIKEEKLRDIILEDGTITNKADLPEGFLTMRYYSMFPENNPAYENTFMDVIKTGSEASKLPAFSTIPNQKVVTHAQEKLPVGAYQNNNKTYNVELQFSVSPRMEEGNEIVDYVDVTVIVKDGTEEIYRKKRRVDLQNTVYYNNEPTMYTDITP